jgi:hypothetical protein
LFSIWYNLTDFEIDEIIKLIKEKNL